MGAELGTFMVKSAGEMLLFVLRLAPMASKQTTFAFCLIFSFCLTVLPVVCYRLLHKRFMNFCWMFPLDILVQFSRLIHECTKFCKKYIFALFLLLFNTGPEHFLLLLCFNFFVNIVETLC